MSSQVIRETATEIVYQATYEWRVPKIQISAEDLPAEDGIPLESSWQRDQINLLIELAYLHWAERNDFYAGGNMFIYYSPKKLKSEDVRGPDFFVVKGVDRFKYRPSWIAWEEDNILPHLIVELISPSTRSEDEITKKRLYEQAFRTPEYYLYYPDEQKLVGWRLQGARYQPITPDERGWLWSEQLELWLGTWQGYDEALVSHTWLRFFDSDGQLIPTHRERAEEAQDQAEKAQERAETETQARAAAEAKIAALEAELAHLKGQPLAST